MFENLREAALTMQQGGGIGHDFSTLRPQGALVAGVGADASGPVSFMDVWDSMCRTIMSAGSRRGAMMATLAVDHPDIEDFITAKRTPGRLSNFNLSVLVSDAFMVAVKNDGTWALRFGGKTYRTVKAKALWETIMRSTYDYAEPGVIFIDRINDQKNLGYCETIPPPNPSADEPPPEIYNAIAAHGIRNSLLTSIAPTGTISLFADNVSSGIEPIFAFSYKRKILQPDGSRREEMVSDYAVRQFHARFGDDAALPD